MMDPASDAWRSWSKERLEREYSPSSTIPDLSVEIAGYRMASEAARRAAPPVTVAYGSRPARRSTGSRPRDPAPIRS